MPHDTARRGFLRQSISILPVSALAAATPAATSTPRQTAALPSAGAARSAYVPSFFHPAEWAFLQAAVARLIPFDALGPGALEAGVPEFIDRQMEGPFGHAANWYMQGPFLAVAPEFGYQAKLPPRDVYRQGMAATDAYCQATWAGQVFAQLTPTQQDQVLKGLESGQIVLDGVAASSFFGFLLQNTKEGYLSDPIHGGNKDAGAWKMIGFPGARADYADWVGRPGEVYPLPPVSIAGPQG